MLHGNASRTLCHFDQTEIACDGELIISAIIFKPLLKTHLQSQIRNCYLGTSERQKHDSDTKLTRTCDQCMTSSDYGGHFYPQLLALPAQYAGQGLYNCRASVCTSICPSQPAAAAAGLLLWAQRAGDIDRLLQGRRALAGCGECHVIN